MVRACIVCGLPTNEGSRCSRHQRQKRPWVKKADRGGYGWAWAQRRKQVLLEEKTCRICGMPATEVDHIVNRAMGGGEERSNLQGLCHRCHRRKTEGEAKRGRH